MMKLAIAVFLAGILRCWSSSSPPAPHRRMMHRSLQPAACRAFTDDLYEKNPNVGTTELASGREILTLLDACDFASGASGECTVDAANLSTITAYNKACLDAGGKLYNADATYSCSAAVDGSEITLTGGLINDSYCYAPTCTLDDIQSRLAGLVGTDYIPASVDQTVFTCTSETSVEAGAAGSGASIASIKLWSVMIVAGVVGSLFS